MQNNPTPNPASNGSMIEPAAQQPFAPAAPGATPLNTGAQLTSDGGAGAAPMVNKKTRSTLIETILLVITSILAIVFIWLYIQKFIEWDALSMNVDGEIRNAVAAEVAKKETQMEEAFAEREKDPYQDFAGPVDYGSFSFKYPRTWSQYIAKDAVNGGDYEAYFNPYAVNPVSNFTINALRLRIRDVSFDSVARSYESSIKNGTLTLKTQTVGGVLANIYTGEVAKDMSGAVMILKLRDKTVLLQTDSMNFIDDFYRIIESVTLVE